VNAQRKPNDSNGAENTAGARSESSTTLQGLPSIVVDPQLIDEARQSSRPPLHSMIRAVSASDLLDDEAERLAAGIRPSWAPRPPSMGDEVTVISSRPSAPGIQAPSSTSRPHSPTGRVPGVQQRRNATFLTLASVAAFLALALLAVLSARTHHPALTPKVTSVAAPAAKLNVPASTPTVQTTSSAVQTVKHVEFAARPAAVAIRQAPVLVAAPMAAAVPVAVAVRSNSRAAKRAKPAARAVKKPRAATSQGARGAGFVSDNPY
jgi:hypothetical protein